MSDLHQRLRQDLNCALRAQDRAAVRVLRTALSAIANAEAQPDLDGTPTSLRSQGPIAGAAAGVGASEVARRTLDDRELRSILETERAECLATAEELEARGAQGQVDALRADAALLDQYIDEADHQATFNTDQEFAQLLKASGGAVTGGAGLAHSSRARTIKRGPKSKALITEGPFAETVEQMSGFFIVTCDDYDGLVEAAQVLTRAHPVVEIRLVEES